MISIHHSVPQGSVLGPIMYTLYINEMGEIPNQTGECTENSHQNPENLFNSECKECGTMFGYADDTTYVSMSKTRHTNQINLSKNLENIKRFLQANKLNINTTKTTLMEVMLQQKKTKMRGRSPNT